MTVAKGPEGRQTASVRPGPGRDGIVFHTFEQDGRLTVLPSDASSLVSQGRLDAEVPTSPADYRLELNTSRTSPDWDYATATTWSFRSPSRDKPTELPLLQLDYAVPVDAHNTITRAWSYGVDVTVRAQDRAPAPHGSRCRSRSRTTTAAPGVRRTSTTVATTRSGPRWTARAIGSAPRT
ncbi:hypothetical protein ACFV7R_40120 [Streptomyces sp. NPDC059866]|uniref:hypothetical protein n=1 Tax=Streptomyces sp. NPDC059866 TaxID=3346978 RepID=UPI0036621BA2